MLEIIRYVVFGTTVAAGAVWLGSWAVRTRRLNPFGRPAALIRRTTDPVLRPVEDWLHRRGGNPQHAEGWLFVGAVAGGIAVMGLATLLVNLAGTLGRAAQGGPFGMVRVAVVLAGRAVSLALVVRVVGSWFGVGRYRAWMRPFYVLTDWIVEPLRRFIPPLAGLDVTPWVAFIIVQVVVSLIV